MSKRSSKPPAERPAETDPARLRWLPAIDPRSAELILFWNGNAVPSGVPARDLSGSDLARFAYVRAHRGLESGRPHPATADELEDLATWLGSTGAFLREAAALAEPPITEEPADPARKE